MNYHKILSQIYQKIIFFKFPYIFTQCLNKYHYKFVIYNVTDEYQIQKWGGEKQYITRILEVIISQDIFYDIGSSLGLISLFVSQKINSGKVICFEPDPKAYEQLNYDLNCTI